MANAKTGFNVKQNNLTEVKSTSLKGLLDSPGIKKRFDEVLGKKAAGFISSLISVYNNDKLLQKANPTTIIAAGAMAATLDLPINPNLGFAYIIPYSGEAQFQMGYKGYIQLAMRTGQYKTINACEVYEGEIESVNRFTGAFKFGERTGDEVIGYMAYFELINGFEKYVYMTIDEMVAHAKKYSKSYNGGTERWGIADFHSMAIKTVLKRLISKYGILSIEMLNMSNALSYDGGVLKEEEDGTITADFDGETVDVDGIHVDTSTGEILEENPPARESLTEEEKAAIIAAEIAENPQ